MYCPYSCKQYGKGRVMLRSLAFCVMGLCIAPMAAVAQDGTSSSDTAPATRPVSEKGMSLQDVLRHVYVNDPGLLAARSSLHATHELYPQALASRRPTISAEASIYTSNIENSNFTQGTGATTKQVSLDAEQPLYTSGRSDAQVDKVNNLIKAAYATYLQAEQDLLYRTAYAYMTVIRDRELLSLSQENENILKEEEKAVTERFQGGELTRTDVEQTKARVAKAQADRLNAWRALETSYAAFEKVTGQQPAGTFYYPVPGFTFPPPRWRPWLDWPNSIINLCRKLVSRWPLPRMILMSISASCCQGSVLLHLTINNMIRNPA